MNILCRLGWHRWTTVFLFDNTHLLDFMKNPHSKRIECVKCGKHKDIKLTSAEIDVFEEAHEKACNYSLGEMFMRMQGEVE